MSNLFVDDEDDYQPTTTTIIEESEEPEIVIKKEYGNDVQLEMSQLEEEEEEEDPIIESIPLCLNTVPNKQTNSLHLLQYPGRSKARPLNKGNYSGSIKLQSQYLEMKLPVETDLFFNKNKVDKWGEEIGEQKLSGVLDSLESGSYCGKLVEIDNVKKIILIPIDSSIQLRTNFKYIDNLDNQTHQLLKKEYSKPDSEVKNVSILQSAAKNSTQNQDGFAHTLGDSLKSIKKFDEEEWKYLNWKNNQQDQLIIDLKHQLEQLEDLKLKTNTKFEDYIDKLINE